MECCSGNKTAPEDEEEDLDGPMEDRSCTDIIFLVLFAAFLVGMVIRITFKREGEGDGHVIVKFLPS